MAVSPGADAPESGRQPVTAPLPTSPLPVRRPAVPADRPVGILAACWVWLVIAGLTALGGLLLCIAALLPAQPDSAIAGAGLGAGLLIGLGLALTLAAVGLVLTVLALYRGRPWARVVLSWLAVVLALGGLLRVVFRDPAGVVLVATLVAVIFMYLPSASAFFLDRATGRPER